MRSILLAVVALVLSAAADAQPARDAQGPGPAATPAPAPLAINWERAAEGAANCERDSANAPHDWGCDVGLAAAANPQLAYVRLGCDCRPTAAGRQTRAARSTMSQSIMVADPPNPQRRYTYRFTAGTAPTIQLPFSTHDDGVLGHGMTMTDNAANRRRVVQLMQALPQAAQLVIEWIDFGNGARGRQVISLEGGNAVLQRLVAICTRPDPCHN